MDQKLTFALVITLIIIAGAFIFADNANKIIDNTTITDDDSLKKFSSEKELADFLETSRRSGNTFNEMFILAGGPIMMANKGGSAPMAADSTASRDFSKTNVQVEGVDEADIAKNDGKYIYTINADKLHIVDAYPANNAKLVSETGLKGPAREIFVNGDKLVVFGSYQRTYPAEEGGPIPEVKTASKIAAMPSFIYPGYYISDTYVDVYDISDRYNPKLTRNLILSGDYYSSRMIGNYAYAIINTPVYYYEGPVPLPIIAENGNERKVQADEIFYFRYPDQSYNYINIIAFNLQDDNQAYSSKTILSGSTQSMYVSTENIYTAFTSYNNIYTTEKLIENVVRPVLPSTIATKVDDIKNSNDTGKWEKIQTIISDYSNALDENEKIIYENQTEQKMTEFENRMSKEKEKTIIHRIGIKDGKITFKGEGSVPGTILNQFSMDESNGYFRIATTTGHISRWRTNEPLSRNNIYVLDEKMNLAGSLEDLAPGEKIYSARFMGERAYMVTFKKVDPLFAIDLKDPYNPKVLGKLKIPGYSDYLHPYDENHIIGIGKDAVESEEGDFAWYQGIKIALFDVSDPTNPREISKYNIGDRGTDSYALQDHKAFLFDREKNLLAIPITLAEIDKSKYAEGKVPDYAYGDYVWQGAYVFSIDPSTGFSLKGRITHVEDDSLEKSGYYYYSDYSIKRVLYIGDVLYTLSGSLVKMNDLESMEEINKVMLSEIKEKRIGKIQ